MSMFRDISSRHGYAKLTALIDAAGLVPQTTAHILELPEDLVVQVLRSGLVPISLPPKEYEAASSRFKIFSILLGYLAKMADYDHDEFSSLWSSPDSKFYRGAGHPPPWQADGLDEYLRLKRHKGLECCLDWLRD